MKKQCDQCGEIFTFSEEKPGKIPRFCGNACRQRAYRKRKKISQEVKKVNVILSEIYPEGIPELVTIAQQLDAIRDKIRTEERMRFEEKLAELDAEKSRAIEKNHAEYEEKRKELLQEAIDYRERCINEIEKVQEQLIQVRIERNDLAYRLNEEKKRWYK